MSTPDEPRAEQRTPPPAAEARLPSDGRAPLPAGRGDLDPALVFVHAAESQNRDLMRAVRNKAVALAQELAARGLVTPEALATRQEQLEAAAVGPERERMLVWADREPNKYDAPDAIELPCAALLPLCQARCCCFSHVLSFQDLDEGKLRWDLLRPYEIRRTAEGRCVHNKPDSYQCELYGHRPASCRRYDCRQDERIWLDFEGRLPAPWPAGGQ